MIFPINQKKAINIEDRIKLKDNIDKKGLINTLINSRNLRISVFSN